MLENTVHRKTFNLQGQAVYGHNLNMVNINVKDVQRFTVLVLHSATLVRPLLQADLAGYDVYGIYIGPTITKTASATDEVAVKGTQLIIGGIKGFTVDKSALVFEEASLTLDYFNGTNNRSVRTGLNKIGIYVASRFDTSFA